MLRNYRQIENIVSNSPPQHYYLSEEKHNYSPLPPPTPTDPLIRFKDHEYQNIPGPTSATGQSRYEWIFRGSTTEDQVPPPMPPQVVPPPTHFTRGETTPISYKGSGGSPDYQNLRVSSVCSEDSVDKIKCVLIGDGAIGKTSLIVSYTTNGYPTEYVPTAFDNYSVIVTIDNKPVRLQLCDTAGQDDFDSLRPLCYPGCDVFIVCFSVVCPTSFVNVKEKWLPELRRHQPDTPVLLVGTQSDLRTDVKVLIELAQDKEEPVSESVASRLAKQTDCVGYVESSALTQRNLKEVFDEALLAALEGRSNARINSHQSIKSKRKNNLNCISDDEIKDGAKRGWRKLCCFV